MPCSVDILLACYQGEKYLPDQLDSIFKQNHTDFQIIARDDGSTDQTLNILLDYAKRYPTKLHILESKEKLGIVGNFNALLGCSKAPITFFSDQDDVWVNNKLKLTLEKMHGSNPILVHSDLEVVDAALQPLYPSFLNYLQIDPSIGQALSRLLIQNMVTGCTVAINRALRTLVYPFPKEALMHDWWMALVAAVTGQILFLSEKTVKYRQHGNNAIGAHKNQGVKALKKLISFALSLEANTKDADLRQAQAEALYKRCDSQMDAAARQVLKEFLEGPQLSILQRKKRCLSHQFYRQGLKKIVPYLLQNRPY